MVTTRTKNTISRKTADEFLSVLEEAGVTDESLRKTARYPTAIGLIKEVIESEDLRGAYIGYASDPYCR